MASGKLVSHLLTPAAHSDLEDIWSYTATTWSLAQADRYIGELERVFSMLVDMLEIARERGEFTPSVRLHPHSGHLIVYTLDSGHLVVVRILGSLQDWQTILNAIDG